MAHHLVWHTMSYTANPNCIEKVVGHVTRERIAEPLELSTDDVMQDRNRPARDQQQEQLK